MSEGPRKRARVGTGRLGIFGHKPVMMLIMTKLPIISQMAMFRAYPELRAQLPKWSIHERFTARLRAAMVHRWPDAPEAMLELLLCGVFQATRQGVRLSGSAILCALIGDSSWLPGDLDYICEGKAPLNPTMLFSQNSGLTPWTSTRQYEHMSRGMILQVLTVEVTHCKVQSIMVRSETPEAFVRECFDLSFLRNTYDACTLRVLAPASVLHKEALLDVPEFCANPMDKHCIDEWKRRYGNYVHRRGFRITPTLGNRTEDQLVALFRLMPPHKSWSEKWRSYQEEIAEARAKYAQWKLDIYSPIVAALEALEAPEAPK